MVDAPVVSSSLDSIYVMGTKLKSELKNAVTSADISMSTSQVTQLNIALVDPGWKILKTGLFAKGIPVRYKDLHFVIANVETTSVSGNEGVTIKCRPETVQKLKNRVGTKIMKKVSPSEFVISECKAVGAKYYVQASSKRSSVSRDKPKAKEKYEADENPSSWTTFNRLAGELGYILFEMAGVIYFGKPTYFLNASKNSPLIVTWKKNIGTDAEQVPNCVKSVDSKKTTVSVVLPPERAKECRVGRSIKLSGVPTFDGYYLIDDVDYSISGMTNRVRISASTPIDPEKISSPSNSSKSSSKSSSSGSSTIAKKITSSYRGVWPISKKYHIGTPFGRRGSWAAGYHTGVDFPAPRGVSVYVVYDGTIAIGGWGGDYGKHVILKVGSKRFGYCHLSKINVHSGQHVRAGQVLGKVGDTGRAFGTHLHFEYRTSPYRYGKDSHNPIPQLGKTAHRTSTKKVTVSKPKAKYPAGKSNTKKASDMVHWALTRTGSRYVFGATRDTSNKNLRTFDCSSLVRWAMARVGIKNFPTTTFTQVPYLRRKGKKISLSTAYRTRGALMYRWNGGDHVAISLGNGRTIEAANSRIGVRSLNAKGRHWDGAWLAPGLRY